MSSSSSSAPNFVSSYEIWPGNIAPSSPNGTGRVYGNGTASYEYRATDGTNGRFDGPPQNNQRGSSSPSTSKTPFNTTTKSSTPSSSSAGTTRVYGNGTDAKASPKSKAPPRGTTHLQPAARIEPTGSTSSTNHRSNNGGPVNHESVKQPNGKEQPDGDDILEQLLRRDLGVYESPSSLQYYGDHRSPPPSSHQELPPQRVTTPPRPHTAPESTRSPFKSNAINRAAGVQFTPRNIQPRPGASEQTASFHSVQHPFDARKSPPHRGTPNKGKGRAIHTRAIDQDSIPSSSEDESEPLLTSISLSSQSFEQELVRLCQHQRASTQALRNRQELIFRLESILNTQNWQWRGQPNPGKQKLVVQPFGSLVTGLCGPESDLDLCLLDPTRPKGFIEKLLISEQNGDEILPQIYNIRSIADHLRRAGFEDIRPVPFAAVPIVKFKAVVNGEVIEADLNVNERYGTYNSALIRAYCDLSPHARRLCTFIKFWAKQRALNDPAGQKGHATFSSYSLNLLVIAYLQNMGVLPNLQDPEMLDKALIPQSYFYSRPRGKRGVPKSGAVGWDVSFLKTIPGWREKQELEDEEDGIEIEDLARGFFIWYADKIDFSGEIVSVNRGEPCKREKRYIPMAPVKNGEQKNKGNDKNSSEAQEVAQSQDVGESLVQAASTSGAEVGTGLKKLTLSQTSLHSQPIDPRSAPTRLPSRTPTPVVGDEWPEPEHWTTHPIVVQDPFILVRNTTQNVKPNVAVMFLGELRRARSLMDEGASISRICASIKKEAAFKEASKERREARRFRVKQTQENKARTAQRALRDRGGAK